MLTLKPAMRRRLADLADQEIGKVLAGESGMIAPADVREAAGSTVSSGLPAAADAWRGDLAALGLTVRMVTSFSFGAPVVEFSDDGTQRRCSIGDLLLVVDDITGAAPDRRAMLLRIGPAAANDSLPGVAERRLYDQWPPFRLTDDHYDDRDRVFAPAERYGGFAEINLAPRARAWSVLSPGAPSPMRASLGRWILDMATGGGNRAERGGADDWSVTIEDLLSRTANATMWGLTSHPRFRSVALYKGGLGSGFVVFENDTGAPLEVALADGPAALPATSSVLSVAHIVFSKASHRRAAMA